MVCLDVRGAEQGGERRGTAALSGPPPCRTLATSASTSDRRRVGNVSAPLGASVVVRATRRRGFLRAGAEYGLTDVRMVRRCGERIEREVILDDITRVAFHQSWTQRLRGTRTLLIHTRRAETLALADLRRSDHLAVVLELLALDRREWRLDDAVLHHAMPSPRPAFMRPGGLTAAAAVVVFVVALLGLGLARVQSPIPVAHAPDDPIAPGGLRRSRAEIMAFMEREVMPFARRALGPLKGGPDKITCETCHGRDAIARSWAMPGVRALPEPHVRLAGMERLGFLLDPQMRNAVYGYLAGEENQTVAGYMRGIVLPGIAALLHRPATISRNRSVTTGRVQPSAAITVIWWNVPEGHPL